MTHPLGWSDKLRIERTVWTLDALLADLPRRARRSARCDVRANLRAAAANVGAIQALRDLGSVRRIALDYLDAEYGEHRPRPRVFKGVFWAILIELVILSWAVVGHEAFTAGLRAAGQPPGTYSWSAMRALGIVTEVSFDDTGFASFSLNIYLWFLAYILAAFVIGGRLWRLIPAWWRARRRNRIPPLTN
jgi:hypothetical protein